MNKIDTIALSNFVGRKISLVSTKDIMSSKPFLTDFVVDKNGWVKIYESDYDVIRSNYHTEHFSRFSSNFFKLLQFNNKQQAFDFVCNKKIGVCEKSDKIRTYSAENGEIFVAYKGYIFTSGTWENIKGFFGF